MADLDLFTWASESKRGLCAEPGCDRKIGIKKAGLCFYHYRKVMKPRWKGTFSTGRPHRSMRANDRAADFWASVDKSGGPDACWPWRLSIRNGHGLTTFKNKTRGTHRVAWELTNGPIPPGAHILHKCDNGACCNPAHLYPGTPLQNAQDMVERNRVVTLRGEKNGASKLTQIEVDAIRASYATDNSRGAITKLAREHGVAYWTIWSIVRNKGWLS